MQTIQEEPTDSVQTIQEEPEEEENLNQVVVAIRNKKMLILLLDDETMDDFELWAESEAVHISEHDSNHSSDAEKKKGKNGKSSSAKQQDSSDEPSAPEAFEYEEEDPDNSVQPPSESVQESGLPVVVQAGDRQLEIVPYIPEQSEDATVTGPTRDVSCQTTSLPSSTAGETSSDNPELAIKKEYRRLPARVRNRRAGWVSYHWNHQIIPLYYIYRINNRKLEIN